jgi:hypothetical protein
MTLSVSYSKIKNFRTCPRRHYHCDIVKDVKEEESEALQWGNIFHTAMEKRILKGERLPPTMLRYDNWGDTVEQWSKEGIVKVEQKLAFDKQFRATNYFDKGTWFRTRIDVAWFPSDYPNQVVLLDWKTGEVKPDEQQLQLSAQAMFAHFPNLEKVVTSYVWIGNDAVTTKNYTPRDMPGLWSSLLPEIKLMENAAASGEYPPKPSGLCRRYCPVKSCEFYGVGSR